MTGPSLLTRPLRDERHRVRQEIRNISRDIERLRHRLRFSVNANPADRDEMARLCAKRASLKQHARDLTEQINGHRKRGEALASPDWINNKPL